DGLVEDREVGFELTKLLAERTLSELRSADGIDGSLLGVCLPEQRLGVQLGDPGSFLLRFVVVVERDDACGNSSADEGETAGEAEQTAPERGGSGRGALERSPD